MNPRACPRFQGENFQRNLDLVDHVRELAEPKGCTPAQLALAWLLARGEEIVPIPGTRSLDRLEKNAGALAVSLNEQNLERIDQIGPQGAAAGERYPEPMMRSLNG